MTDPDGTARRPADAERWAALHADELIGRPIAEAVASIQEAGLRRKVVHTAAVTTLEFRVDRITVEVDDKERVTGLHAG